MFFQDEPGTPVGRLLMCGALHKTSGGEMKAMRVLGSYALVYLARGAGFYQDANGCRQKVRAGDALLIVPELAHRYGPGPRQEWDELYFVFDGPVFDLWRERGVLNAARPVQSLQPAEAWLPSLLEIARTPAHDAADRLERLCRFLTLFSRVLRDTQTADNAEAAWLLRAQRALGNNLEAPLDLRRTAREAGLSYETFRKRFQTEVGVSPARFRAEKQIAAARAMLEHTDATHRAIATSLGFSDEFHFSKRFKQLTGLSPRQYRRQSRP